MRNSLQNTQNVKFKSRKPKFYRHKTDIKEDLVFGIDLGIASVGWAVLKDPKEGTPEIQAMGSWCFDAPEEEKDKSLKNQTRREARLHRRVIRRRCQRMNAIRALFYENKLLESKAKNIFHKVGAALRKQDEHDKNPWALRVAGLDGKLEKEEFAIALAHIAKHRGVSFGIKKTDAEQNEKKQSEYDKSIIRVEDDRRSYAEEIIDKEQYRNRSGEYRHTPHRELLKKEVAHIFAKQRELGNDWASIDLENKFNKIAFSQLPLQDSSELVGLCTFERGKKRAAKYAPSFEKFRLLDKINNLKIQEKAKKGEEKKGKVSYSFIDWLKYEQEADISSFMDKISQIFKEEKGSVTAEKLRVLSGLPKENFDLVSDGSKFKEIALKGSYALYEVLKEDYDALGEETLDKIAAHLTHKTTEKSLKKALKKEKISQEIMNKLLEESQKEKGAFKQFNGVGHLSSKALRKIIPYLKEGMTYDKACKEAGYNHSQNALFSGMEQLESKQDFNKLTQKIAKEVSNAVVRKAITEGLKQLWAMRVRYGLPSKINIELARDVGKSAKERGEIEKHIQDVTKERQKERKAVAEILGKEKDSVTSKELLRYRLWKEQNNNECVYTGKHIAPNLLKENDSLEIDHILPLSRFGDDSFSNKVLVFKNANQDKGNQTALEWFENTKNQEEVEAFKERIRTMNCSRSKKEKLLFSKNNKNSEDYETKMRTRSLNDTRYTTRLFAQAAEFFYDENNRGKEAGSTRRIFARAGGITSSLRHSWGVEKHKYKKNDDGKKERLEDSRNHALDALVVACCTESMLQKITKYFQENEEKGLKAFKGLKEPWEGFRKAFEANYKDLITARPEKHRARGQAHKETIYSAVSCEDGSVEVYQSKQLEGVKPADAKKLIENLKDPERNKHIKEALEEWIESDCKDLPILKKTNKNSNKSADILRKITIKTANPGVYLSKKREPDAQKARGMVSRGSMVRVDVYSQQNMKGTHKGKKSYYLVPIYAYQIINKKKFPTPPMLACVGAKEEKDWIKINEDFRNFKFEFSLYSGSYIKTQKKGEEIQEGYYATTDRTHASIKIRKVNASIMKEGSFTAGVKNLELFKKYQINRFGEKYLSKEEKITWHGQARTLEEWCLLAKESQTKKQSGKE